MLPYFRLSPAIVPLAAATAVATGCGALRTYVLADSGKGIPLDYAEENFRAGRAPSDLAQDTLSALEPHLERAVTCYGNGTPAGVLLSEAMNADSAFAASLNRIAPLPDGIPSVPQTSDLMRARKAFVEAKRASTAIEKSHEVTADSELFTKVTSPWRPGSTEFTAQVSAAFAKQNVRLERLRLRRFFARSLEPDNEYQWLVVCGDIDARLPGNLAARHTWPVFSSQELNKGPDGKKTGFVFSGGAEANEATDIMTVTQSLRDTPDIVVSNGFTFLTPEVFAAVSRKTPTTLRVQLRTRAASAIAGFRSLDALAWRENRTLHFSRFIARGTEVVPSTPVAAPKPTEKSGASVSARLLRAFTSFQHVAPKAAWESVEADTSSAGSANPSAIRVSAKAGPRYLDAACAPIAANADPSFLPGGLHHIESKTAKKEIDSLVANSSDVLALSLGDAVCKSLVD